MRTTNLRPQWRFRLAALACVALFVLGVGPGPASSVAEVPAGGPLTFSNPLQIDNAYFPVVPGTVRIYIGRENGRTITIVENHLEETREFEWDGQIVSCWTVEELKFENGQLLEQENSWYAQDDAGNVHVWGDIDLIDDPDDEDGEEPPQSSGWVVGQLQPMDPPDVLAGSEPALIMPANPEQGDLLHPEATLPFFQTQSLVEDRNIRVRTPAGRFGDCVRIRQEDLADGGGETLWFAPGKGLVKVSGPGERLKLQASTAPELE